MNTILPPPSARRPLVARTTMDTPLGPMLLAATERGLAVAWFEAQKHSRDLGAVPVEPMHAVLRQAEDELRAYFDGRLRAFAIPLDPQGTPFQQAVWAALLAIAAGDRSTYGEVARRVGRPAAVRAVGAAIGRNPVGIVIPCHRVVGASGSLTGYAGGLPRKQALLALEDGAGLLPFADFAPPTVARAGLAA
jgi:methylated-DNA-[protein]-cysteine S-methyltransferase